MIRPICEVCNKNHRAINYKRNGITHYRRLCDPCGTHNKKKKPKLPNWQKAGYKKKTQCDMCGYRTVYPSQTTVFHIDGNLSNTVFSNLRTICLNCVEIVKRKEVNWKRGDLTIDY